MIDPHVTPGLYAHAYLVMAAGHGERDGLVVLTDARDPDARATPLRVPANRAAHLDDERFVFPDRRLAASSRLPV